MRLNARRPLLLLFVPLLLLTALLAACSDEPDEDEASVTPSGSLVTATAFPEPASTQTATPAATASTPAGASPTPPPDTVDALEYLGYEIVGDFTYADAIEFPQDLLVVVETGCNQCDGPTEGLYRVWRNSGDTHVELLIDATISGSDNAYVTSFAMRPDLSDIVVTVCTLCGGGNPFIESPIAIYRSLDGGTTWREIDRTRPGEPVYARAITNGGIVLERLDQSLVYWRGDRIEPPADAGELLHGSRHAGALRWLADDGSTVLDQDGVPVALVEPGSLISDVAMDGPNPVNAVTGWGIGYVEGPFDGWTATKVGPDGRLLGFRTSNYLAPVAVLRAGNVLGVMSATGILDGGAIGYIDVLKGVLTPFAGPMLQPPFGDGTRAAGRNSLHAALPGPFLRVNTGINCLPIRQTTDVNSPELTCAADGTLLYDRRGSTTVGGQEWSRVLLLDGREGYAVSSFLTAD